MWCGSMALADSMRIAARLPGRRRRRCATSQPSISGMAMSSRMRFGLVCSTSARHSRPDAGAHDHEAQRRQQIADQLALHFIVIDHQ